MPQSDGYIDSTNLCSQAVVERVLGDYAVTSIKIYNTLESDNFSSGSAGWQINRVTGSAEFQDVIVRGTLNADDITAGTMAATYLGAGTIGVEVIKLSNSSNSRIESNDGTSLLIEGDGTFVATSATITGAITATSGSLGSLSVTGSLTLSGSGILRTASSGKRIELTATDNDNIKFYTGESGESTAARIGPASTGSTSLSLDLWGPVDTSGSSSNAIQFYSKAASASYGIDMTSVHQGIRLDGRTNGVEIWGATGASSAHVATFENDQIKAEDGTSGAPMYTFVDDTDLGLYRSTTNVLGIAANGSQVLIGNGYARFPAGSQSAPGISFTSDTNTGIYRSGAGEVAISSDNERAFMALTTSSLSRWYGTAADNWFQMDDATSQVSIYIASTRELLLGSSGFLVPNVYNTDTTGGSTVYVDSDGTLHRDTSTLRNKQNVKPAPELADIDLTPISYTKKGTSALGFAAEHLAQQDFRLGVFNPDGMVDNFVDRGVLAVMAAKLNRLEDHCGIRH